MKNTNKVYRVHRTESYCVWSDLEREFCEARTWSELVPIGNLDNSDYVSALLFQKAERMAPG